MQNCGEMCTIALPSSEAMTHHYGLGAGKGPHKGHPAFAKPAVITCPLKIEEGE